MLNATRPPFNDKRLRQAIAWAIDRAEIVKLVYFGSHVVTAEPTPEPSPWATGVNAHKGGPDLAKAKQLMAEAGYKGEEIVLVAHLIPDYIAQEAVVIQSQLQRAGFNIKVQALESAALQQTWTSGDFALFLSGLTPRPDADVYYCQTNETATSNAGFKNADYDRLCKAGRETTKPEERAKIYAELEKLRRTELPYFPTIYYPQVAAWRENVKGIVNWAAGYARVWNVSK
jgi:peptide/nickel transport system substrate-binding protein